MLEKKMDWGLFQFYQIPVNFWNIYSAVLDKK